MGWKLNPDEPKYFHLKLWTLPGEKPVPIVDEQVSEKIKKEISTVVTALGFETTLDRIEPFKAVSAKHYKFGFN